MIGVKTLVAPAEEPAARFAHWLDVTMSNRGIKGVDLAAEIGVAGSAISRWRSGTSLPGMDACVKLAQALGVDPGRLAVTAGLVPEEVSRAAGLEPLPIPPPTARRQYLKKQIDAIKGVTPEMRRKLMETLDEAIEKDGDN